MLPAIFPLREGHYTAPAWMTRDPNLRAFGVDDTLLVLALATSCSPIAEPPPAEERRVLNSISKSRDL
jgi:hypothetical protein